MLQIDAIFRHESQKDRALFPGADPREFWQRARDRNEVCLPHLTAHMPLTIAALRPLLMQCNVC